MLIVTGLASGEMIAAQPATNFSARSDLLALENQKPGTTDWIITKITRDADEPYEKGWHRRTLIEGYTSKTSVEAGESITFYVSTAPADRYTLDIFRMGYYGGKGGRLVKSMTLQGRPQPTPSEGGKHLIQCDWAAAAILQIPSDWVSGVYLAKLSALNTNGQAYMIFIVRDHRKADIIFQCSDMTWQAYNRWPQWHSLYDSPTDPWGSAGPVGYDISFDRPYALYWNLYPSGFNPLTNGSGEFLMTEFPLAFWLEKQGYDVTYISQVDTHEDGSGLLHGKVFLSVGHDEYWTPEMLAHVSQARDAGVNLAFLSGNAVSGRIQLLPDAQGNPNRVIRKINPRYGEAAAKLMGASSHGVGLADWTCVRPDHWAFAGTGMKKGDSIPELVGWEYHGPPLASDKDNLVVLAEGRVTSYEGTPTDNHYTATLYTAPKGNYVFNAATCWWTQLLSAPPGYVNPPFRFFSEGDPRVQQITKNILDHMIATPVNN
jgi:hypothetical protein